MSEQQAAMEMRRTELLEALAELEHEQWLKWSMELADLEDLSAPRKKRWLECWKPYSELTEEQKYFDRIWAEQVLWIVKKHMGIK